MTNRGLILGLVFSSTFIGSALAEEVMMKAEKAVVITFDSQTQRTYKLLGAQSAAGQWDTLKDGIVGTGGEVTIFYKSESDQKLFFKVETSDGPPGQRSLLSLANLNISNKDLTGYDLEGDDLRGYYFHKSIFNNANLSAANLTDARFSEASFVGADLSHAIVEGADLGLANFNGANLEGIKFVGCFAELADFRNANLKGVQFDGTVLKQANFSGQTLTNVSFRASGSKWKGQQDSAMHGVNFSGANLTGADLSRNDAYYMNVTGANLTGVNFEGSVLSGVSFVGHDLRTVLLRGTSQAGGNWSSVNANGADISLANLGVWIATGASFEGANLEGVDIGNPNYEWPLTNINFKNAILRGANLEGIVFKNCDFTGADLSFANVIAANFSGCVGLDPEQPGMQFGGYPNPFPGGFGRPTATTLPDGSARTGTNPGVSTAPAIVPPRLQLVNNEPGGTTRNLQLDGWTFWEGGAEAGTFTYKAIGRKAVLSLNQTAIARTTTYTLLFTSPTGGELYLSDYGTYRIGTFIVPQP